MDFFLFIFMRDDVEQYHSKKFCIFMRYLKQFYLSGLYMSKSPKWSYFAAETKNHLSAASLLKQIIWINRFKFV